ncbi:MAG: TetR/AcrR family transcriptional regulator [Chloroflexi bacterium]|nr:TetR/AcrR family transcriptional regulator [Chloroflexota bacterium]
MTHVQDGEAVRRRKAEQSDRTRAALVAVARALFAERGYAGTATEEIVQAAGVTRGALYHHFRDKQDLFEAVYRELQTELRARIVQATRVEADVWERVRAGFHEYLDRSMDPTVQRIVLIDAPSVLGWERWRAIDGEFALGLLRAGMERLRQEGVLDAGISIEHLSHLLLGVVSEASHVIAGAADVPAARREVGGLVDRFLDALRAR